MNPEEMKAFSERIARMNRFEERVLVAIDALAEVLEDPELTAYQPHRDALSEALHRLEMDVTCGDCIEGRCHWGGETSQQSIAAVEAGREFDEECGCARHAASVECRERRARLGGKA
jgi:hypothetical protein